MRSIEASQSAPPRIIYQWHFKRRKPSHCVGSSVDSNNLSIFSSSSTIDPKMSIDATGKDAYTWTVFSTKALLDILISKHSDGTITGKSVKDKVWQEVTVELNNRIKETLTVTQVKDKNKRMKKDWSEFHQLVKTTGGSWDPQLFTILATPAMQKKMAGNPVWTRVQKRGLKRYDEMTLLWAGGTATGSYARSSTNAEIYLEEEMERDNTEYSGGSRTKRYIGKRTFDIQSSQTATTSNSSKSRKLEDLKREVMTEFLAEDSVTGGGGVSKWKPAQCLADVRQLDGITPLEVVNAGSMFHDPVQREIYMDHTPAEKLLWVEKYCR